MFSDEADMGELGMLDIDVQHIALSGRFALPVNDALALYVGAGVSYNIVDVDAPGLSAIAGDLAVSEGSGDEYAAFVAGGGTLSGGLDVNVDDAIGYHACAGLTLALSDSVELFGEYRFTWLDMEGDMSVNLTATLNGTVVEQLSESQKLDEGSYDFGLARIGVNIQL